MGSVNLELEPLYEAIKQYGCWCLEAGGGGGGGTKHEEILSH